MDQQNRENFLNKLAAKMGRARKLVPDQMEEQVNHHPTTRLTHLSQNELCNEFMSFAKVLLVDVVETKEADVAQAVLDVCEKYGGGNIVLNNDDRLNQLGITDAVKAKYDSFVWDFSLDRENIAKSAEANIGIVHAEYGLAVQPACYQQHLWWLCVRAKYCHAWHNLRKCYMRKHKQAKECHLVLTLSQAQVQLRISS